MSNSKNLFSLDEFLGANSEKALGAADYLHAVFKLANLPIDLAFCFIQLLTPKFNVVDGLIFIEENFNADEYNRYISEGKAESEIQLWVNLIEITGIFEEIGENDAVRLGNEISRSWNICLNQYSQLAKGIARVIHDVETGEVYVTIDQYRPG